MKIILHLNELQKWNLAFGNIQNILKAEPQSELEILIHSEPLKNLTIKNAKELNLYNQLEDFSKKGVVIAACNNTMNAFSLTKDDMCPFVTIVPAGVVELAKKQEEGFSYIKP
ncbi:MAG: DsrE family protein [Sarcina sp.]